MSFHRAYRYQFAKDRLSRLGSANKFLPLQVYLEVFSKFVAIVTALRALRHYPGFKSWPLLVIELPALFRTMIRLPVRLSQAPIMIERAQHTGRLSVSQGHCKHESMGNFCSFFGAIEHIVAR